MDGTYPYNRSTATKTLGIAGSLFAQNVSYSRELHLVQKESDKECIAPDHVFIRKQNGDVREVSRYSTTTVANERTSNVTIHTKQGGTLQETLIVGDNLQHKTNNNVTTLNEHGLSFSNESCAIYLGPYRLCYDGVQFTIQRIEEDGSYTVKASFE
jgi:hypothetical protein